MTHTHTALSLTGCMQGMSNLERIIEMKGFKLEYKKSVKLVAVRAKTERHLISFNESLFPPFAEDTR